MTTVGIIGGTGLYNLEGMTSVREIKVDTPFGEPSDVLVTGELQGVRLVFVPRHGRGHRLLPSEVPYRPNVFALKSLGVEWLLSVSAVGSMQEDIHPGQIVIPAQYIDRTRGRPSTFFGDGIVAHVGLADPVCPTLAAYLTATVTGCGLSCHSGGTYVCMEGPAFSTRAESLTYRQWGVDVIGMTAIPECKLAREAELHYATLALVTDFDCWHQAEEDVSVDAVLETLRQNTSNVRKILERALPGMDEMARKRQGEPECTCHDALANAIVTNPDVIPAERLEALQPIVGKYLS
ncbi:S-methyl-5'-thioadenosine phosphorylase [Myxococcota bacterium]